MATTTLTYQQPPTTTMTSSFAELGQKPQHQRPSRPSRSQTWRSMTPNPQRPVLRSSPSSRSHSRSSSSSSSSPYSTAWYTADESQHSLEVIAARLNTYASRFERFLGKCAQNIVMALFRPTPLLIFLFHPLFLMMWVVLAVVWLVGKLAAG